MKKNQQRKVKHNTMLPEYDFTGKQGVRGKYYQAYRQGHTVKVRKADGTVSTRYFSPTIKSLDLRIALKPDRSAR